MMTTNLPRAFALIASMLLVGSTHAAVPKISRVVTDAAGQSGIETPLAVRRGMDAPADQIVRGTIRDPRGNPVVGATIEVTGVGLRSGSRRFGAVNETDPLVVSDEMGEFVFRTTVPVDSLVVHVSGLGIANQTATLAMGQTHHLIATAGASVTGRVVRDGRPVPGIVVGISPQDRRAGSYVGHFETETDAEGRFSLSNLPAMTDYFLYGTIASVSGRDAIAVRRLYVGRDGSTTDVGEIGITSTGHRVRGRIELADGGELPEGVQIRLGRDSLPDYVVVNPGPAGTFEFTGVPTGVVSLSARVPGYAISSKNESFDISNRRLLGRIDGDKQDLVVLLELASPSGRLFTSITTNAPATRNDRPGNRLLRGIEPSSP